MVAAQAQQIPLEHVRRRRSGLAARVVYCRLLLGAEDTAEACSDTWHQHMRWEEADLVEYVAELELELRKRGKPTLGGFLAASTGTETRTLSFLEPAMSPVGAR